MNPGHLSPTSSSINMAKTTLTRPAPHVWKITLANAPENRLDFDVLNDIRLHLDEIEAEWRSAGESPGAVVFDSANPKFFSNGFVVANLRRAGFSERGWGGYH